MQTSDQELTRRTGVEVELLAPPGSDRLELATEIADRCGGHVRRTSHTDSEPSLVPGMGHFWHTTPAFAVHLHLDAGPFRSVAALTNLVRLFGHWRGHLRQVLGTNPACTRLQPLPEALLVLADPGEASSAPARSDWARFQQAAAATGITKYYDVNLTALLTDAPLRDTVEVRILPGALHAGDIISRAALLEGLLERCQDPRPLPRPTTDAATEPSRAAQELLALAARTAGTMGARGEG